MPAGIAGRRSLLVSRLTLLWVVLLAVAATDFALTSLESSWLHAAYGETRSDAVKVDVPQAASGQATLPLALIADCRVGEAPPACGLPPARWEDGRAVVFCTSQAHRPQWLGEERFREAADEAVSAWNGVDANIEMRYKGDCPSDGRREPRNGRNEIAFDDERQFVYESEIAATEVRFSRPAGTPAIRAIYEADIVVRQTVASRWSKCLSFALAHEIGHALGLGHSDDAADVMFDEAGASRCRTEPSADEQLTLRLLYGPE